MLASLVLWGLEKEAFRKVACEREWELAEVKCPVGSSKMVCISYPSARLMHLFSRRESSVRTYISSTNSSKTRKPSRSKGPRQAQDFEQLVASVGGVIELRIGVTAGL